MIVVIFLIVGFFMTSGAFGAQLVGAFDLLIYWLWFTSIITTLIALAVIVGVGVMGADLTKKKSALAGFLAGGTMGTFLAVFIVAISYTMLWLSYHIVQVTPLDAVNVFELPDESRYSLIAFTLLWIVSVIRSMTMKSNNG